MKRLRDASNLEEVLALGIPAVVLGHQRKEVTGLINVVKNTTPGHDRDCRNLIILFRNVGFPLRAVVISIYPTRGMRPNKWFMRLRVRRASD